MSNAFHRYIRIVSTHRWNGLAGIIGGIGLLVWGVFLFGRFNATPFSGFGSFELFWFVVVAVFLLIELSGAYVAYVDGVIGKVAVFGMSIALAGGIIGGVVGLGNSDLGAMIVFAVYIFVVSGGTLLGIVLLRGSGPRVAGWLLTASLPVLAVTDKILWTPLSTSLGVDIAPLLFVWPLGFGMLLLGVAIHRSSSTAESMKDNEAEPDRRSHG